MAYLFDADAISELFRRKPARDFQDWMRRVHRSEQYTCTIVLGELYQGAYRAEASMRHLENIELRVLATMTVLPFDLAIAKLFGAMDGALIRAGRRIGNSDVQIAATAMYHDLVVVTGNLRHFGRIPGLRIDPVLFDARRLTQ